MAADVNGGVVRFVNCKTTGVASGTDSIRRRDSIKQSNFAKLCQNVDVEIEPSGDESDDDGDEDKTSADSSSHDFAEQIPGLKMTLPQIPTSKSVRDEDRSRHLLLSILTRAHRRIDRDCMELGVTTPSVKPISPQQAPSKTMHTNHDFILDSANHRQRENSIDHYDDSAPSYNLRDTSLGIDVSPDIWSISTQRNTHLTATYSTYQPSAFSFLDDIPCRSIYKTQDFDSFITEASESRSVEDARAPVVQRKEDTGYVSKKQKKSKRGMDIGEIYLGRVVNQIRSLCYKATVDKRYNKWKRIRPPTTIWQKPQKSTTVRNLIDKHIDPFYEESVYPETDNVTYLQCKNIPRECDQWATGFIPNEEVEVFSNQLLEREMCSDPVLISEPSQENVTIYQESIETVEFADDSSSPEEPLETTSEECFRNSTNYPDVRHIQRLSPPTYLQISALSQDDCHTEQTVMADSKECVSVQSECCNLVPNLEIAKSMAEKTPRPQSMNISLECPRPPIWSPRENISVRCAKRHHRSPRGRCIGSSKDSNVSESSTIVLPMAALSMTCSSPTRPIYTSSPRSHTRSLPRVNHIRRTEKFTDRTEPSLSDLMIKSLDLFQKKTACSCLRDRSYFKHSQSHLMPERISRAKYPVSSETRSGCKRQHHKKSTCQSCKLIPERHNEQAAGQASMRAANKHRNMDDELLSITLHQLLQSLPSVNEASGSMDQAPEEHSSPRYRDHLRTPHGKLQPISRRCDRMITSRAFSQPFSFSMFQVPNSHKTHNEEIKRQVAQIYDKTYSSQ